MVVKKVVRYSTMYSCSWSTQWRGRAFCVGGQEGGAVQSSTETLSLLPVIRGIKWLLWEACWHSCPLRWHGSRNCFDRHSSIQIAAFYGVMDQAPLSDCYERHSAFLSSVSLARLDLIRIWCGWTNPRLGLESLISDFQCMNQILVKWWLRVQKRLSSEIFEFKNFRTSHQQIQH